MTDTNPDNGDDIALVVQYYENMQLKEEYLEQKKRFTFLTVLRSIYILVICLMFAADVNKD